MELVGDALGGARRDGREEIICVRTDGKVVGCGEKCGHIRYAVGGIGNCNGAEFAEETGNVAGEEFLLHGGVAGGGFHTGNRFDESVARGCAGIARRERDVLGEEMDGAKQGENCQTR